jgi:hypothetical protein
VNPILKTHIHTILILLTLVAGQSVASDRLDFNRDVRPILSDKCFSCHGFDEKARQADLRLDVRESAVAENESVAAIVPGKPNESELIRRIESGDDSERMPPPDSKKSLSEKEQQLLRRWIAEGATYQVHWSLLPPSVSRLPEVQQRSWPRNAVDHFVLATLEREQLAPSPEAARETLLRRVALDLTGLPPTLEELDQFLNDTAPHAYERAVDRLFASPQFGERMAVEWLDLARYADTNGYFGDKTRSAWPWRDWVIDAYNRNVPFDQFTIEQLAGDLLPDATRDQKIATGFNRNHMANNETGIIDEEYRVEYVADRLETTAAAWLGLTIGCARCHDHKFDPITQKEFYQLFAFFNNVAETGLITKENPPPILEVPSPELKERLQTVLKARDQAEQAFASSKKTLLAQIAAWEPTASKELSRSPEEKLITYFTFDDRSEGTAHGTDIQFDTGLLGRSVKFDATQHLEADAQLDVNAAWTMGVWLQADSSLGCVLSKVEPTGNRRGLEILWQKGRLQIHLSHQWGVHALEVVTSDAIPGKTWQHVVLSYDGSQRAAGLRVYVNGERAEFNIVRDTLDGSIANTEPLRIGRRDSGLGFYGKLDELRILGRSVEDHEVADWYWSERLRGVFSIAASDRSAADKDLLLDYFVDRHADLQTKRLRRELQAAKTAVTDVRNAIPTALVMQELPFPRTTSLLVRGQYDQPSDAVQADVPAVLPAFDQGLPRNRLGFARWLVSSNHPLTARVTVNRLWQQCFGEGLVRTVTDFGSQGEPPLHPELLDCLAVQFVRSNWDVKALLKTIVTSATYRQSSTFTKPSTGRDPENRLFARGPSFRLSAEIVRDQALSTSGMLVSRLGGPSVKPVQPPGLWEAVSYNGEETYVADRGEGLWRRSMYSFWKRQAPPPAMITFDGPTREKCTARRARTNTPLQALVLFNDETYLAAARHLAIWAMAQSGGDRSRLAQAFRRVLSRAPDDDEVVILSQLLASQRTHYETRIDDAKKLVSVGGPLGNERLDATELAAWTVTLQSLFNLDETISRR